jgi:4-hydroxy-tetrahydrodipicolinate synthase
MNRDSIDWKGNLCAVVTPFNADGSIDEEAFVANIRMLVDEGVIGVVVAGCTGEFWSLTEEERLRLFDLARDATDKVVVGNASEIVTSRSIRYAQGAKDRGLDGIMLTPPYYAKPSSREIVAHFQRVSDAVEIPILLYNIPSRQAVAPPVSVVDQLADIDNVVAMKQSASSFAEVLDTIATVGSKILMLPGHSVDRGVPSLLMGADGYVSSVESQVMGREAIQMYDLVAAGEIDEARRVQMRCIALDKAIHGDTGTFPASLKAAMNLRGRPGGHPREPLLPLTDQELANLRRTLDEIGLLTEDAIA